MQERDRQVAGMHVQKKCLKGKKERRKVKIKAREGKETRVRHR